MAWITRFALILFVRMVARAEQAMLARGARVDASGRPFHGPRYRSNTVPRDVCR